MIIAQVYLRLATIKSTLKSAVLLYWGSKNQSVSVWPPFGLTQCNTSPSHRVDQVIKCGLWNVFSSSMAVWSYWILAGTGTRCRIRWPRASQTCSMGDMSGEYAGLELGCFQFQDCVQILATWAVRYNAATWGDGCGWMAQQWASGSRHGISLHSKCHQ